MKPLISALVIALCLTTSVLFAQNLQPRPPLSDASVTRLEQTIPPLMTEADIPGLSIALIRDSNVIWTHSFGVTNSETKAPVNDNTVFEAASLTKPVFAYAVLKLVDSGKLDLDTPLVKYLPGRYDVGDDSRLDQITARHVLSHTTGFPNWRPRGDKTLKMYFTPGNRFSYSGEGFVYLSKVVEQITGESLVAFMKRTVFDPLEMKSSNLVWRDDYESLKTFTHDSVGGVSGRGKPDKPNAAASLHTTANDYAKFVIAMLKVNGLKPATARLMLTPQSSVTLAGAFNLNTPDAKLSPTVSWGLGWGLEKTHEGMAFWHWGDNGDTKAFVLAFPKQKTGLVMFANSANGLSIINELVGSVMGNDHPALAWLNLEQYNSYARLMLKAIIKSDAETVLADYRHRREMSDKLQLVDQPSKSINTNGNSGPSLTGSKTKDQSPKTKIPQPEEPVSLTENQMNRLGYQLLRVKRIKDAIAVFKQNTVDFPQAFNTWDSLAEGYMIDGDKELAIKYYKKSLELNPDNTNAVQKLKELGAQSNPPAKLTPEQWREDLRYFATNMEKTHKNLFHSMTRAQFEAALRKLDERLPTLSEHEIIVELMRIVAMIGDGHTAVRANQKFTSVYPLRLYLFKDGLFVRAAAPEYRDAVGARVLKIGNTDVEQALRAVREIVWRDNEMGVKEFAPMLLVVPEILHALRLADSLQQAEFVVEKENRQIKIEVKPSAQINHLPQPPATWIDAARLDAKAPTPLWLKDPQNIFWYEYLKEPNLLYVQFNGVANKPDETVESFFKRVFEFIEANQVDKLVLDLRLNGGGNNFLNRPLTIGTIKSRVNKRGKLFVIIGRDTFSAAQNTVNELEKYTNAIFVGEPTSAHPNHYGDSRNITLPNSKLVVRASTLWWQDVDPRDSREWTAPEIAAELTSSNYFANHDPAMTAILEYDPAKSLGEVTARALTAADIASFIKEYRTYKADPAHVYVDTEAVINRLGYESLGRNRPEDVDKAIEVFKLNVEYYPSSANVYDSLAEAYLKKGNKDLAIKFYSKALELDPNYPSALEALRQLKAN